MSTTVANPTEAAQATSALIDLGPATEVALTGAMLAMLPLAWVAWRLWREGGAPALRNPLAWQRALTWATLFLTLDLVVFGAFTRLTDSGLGCPDWPGCYGSASPLGAHGHIAQAQSLLPEGPVTHGKAWVEMLHRYLATGVGGLITLLMGLAWWTHGHRGQHPRGESMAMMSPWWPTGTFVWVCVQGAFGALTVTLKLAPLVVSMHLLGGLTGVALLAAQVRMLGGAGADRTSALSFKLGLDQVPAPLARAAWCVGLVWVAQALLGAWVSTNGAVLACAEFPTCQGQWWPAMEWSSGFTLLRALGQDGQGGHITLAALTAIHMAHRMGAVLACLAVCWLASRAWQLGARRLGVVTLGLLALQVGTGLSNVVLGWPLLAALGHTLGAALMITWLTMLAVQPRPMGQIAPACPPLCEPAGPLDMAASTSPSAIQPASSGGADAVAAPPPALAPIAQTGRPESPASAPLPPKWRQFYVLTKPRVVQLIVFCAVIGMLLAVPGWPTAQEGLTALAACVGIWLVAGAAAAFNCLVEQGIDARMKRTAWRPTARGELTRAQTLSFSLGLCAAGGAVLYLAVNPLTLWLTLATFVGYAVVYTVVLKPLTPQNIVIGGASGAMPPVLGWAAMRDSVDPESLMLCLIIFLWTPPHFWALALYRVEDYARAGLPMLPVTHGNEFTRLHVLLYTIVLLAATALPYIYGMSGHIYLFSAMALGLGFVGYAFRLWRHYSDELARKTFRFSIIHLMLLFAALLVDHYVWL